MPIPSIHRYLYPVLFVVIFLLLRKKTFISNVAVGKVDTWFVILIIRQQASENEYQIEQKRKLNNRRLLLKEKRKGEDKQQNII